MEEKGHRFLNVSRKVFAVLAWVFLAIFLFVGIAVVAGQGGVGSPRTAGLFFILWGITLFFIFTTASHVIGLLLDIASRIRP